MCDANNNPSVAEIGSQSKSERSEEEIAQRQHFESLYAEWLLNRCETLTKAGNRTDEELEAHLERQSWLARQITTTPAAVPYMLQWKLDVLEHYLAEGSNWTDQREILMLAGIKADLVRFQCM